MIRITLIFSKPFVVKEIEKGINKFELLSIRVVEEVGSVLWGHKGGAAIFAHKEPRTLERKQFSPRKGFNHMQRMQMLYIWMEKSWLLL